MKLTHPSEATEHHVTKLALADGFEELADALDDVPVLLRPHVNGTMIALMRAMLRDLSEMEDDTPAHLLADYLANRGEE